MGDSKAKTLEEMRDVYRAAGGSCSENRRSAAMIGPCRHMHVAPESSVMVVSGEYTMPPYALRRVGLKRRDTA
jgi:hypothetical protein